MPAERVKAMLNQNRLERALKDLRVGASPPPDVRVRSTDRGFVAIVTSPGFVGMNEGKRLALVWRQLMKSFQDDELVAVEFVFANAPSEKASDSEGS